ncbi:MAG: YitT family protein [Prevotella sp.]|nr:YitT family protein [Prevotella sp.]MBR3089396.1 YitT family protein [Prevotella sp.]
METQKISRKLLLSELHDYAFIFIGILMCASGWVVFLLPNHIMTGGTPGISSILEWGMGIDVEYSYIAINGILLLIALKILGLRFCVKTIYAVALFSTFIPILRNLVGDRQLLSDQLFMATVVGACFWGCGVGISLAAHGSTGGSDVVAAIVNKYKDISLGHAILITDLLIITSSYLVLRDWEQVIYGYVMLFISTFCVDQVVNMSRRSVQFFIITEKYNEIGEQINNNIHRGCTLIKGQGFYSGRDVNMLFVLARRSESGRIFALINEIDPKAFVSQSAVIGVYGEGFEGFKARLRTKKHE